MRESKNYDGLRIVLSAFLLVAMLMAPEVGATTVSGEGLSGSFQFGVSADASVLAYADDPEMLPIMQMQAGWKFHNQIQMAYNMPALKITNDAGSSGNIVQLELTIGDDRFNFANTPTGALTMGVANLNSPVSVTSRVVTSSGASTSAGADDADRLILEFGNGGLSAEEMTMLNVRIESDSVFPVNLPSFENVFFDASGFNLFDGNVYNPGTDDNSMVIVTYEDPSNGNQETTDPVALSDFFVSPPTGTAIHPMPVVDPHFVNGALGTAVPEPTTACIALAGIGLLVTGRRFRRS